jgi:hypothetical protein
LWLILKCEEDNSIVDASIDYAKMQSVICCDEDVKVKWFNSFFLRYTQHSLTIYKYMSVYIIFNEFYSLEQRRVMFKGGETHA